jgi:hypothetical protein
MNSIALTISNTAIRQDSEGRYCLNDLHKAAIAYGCNQRTKEPGKFLLSPQTIEIIEELDTQNLGIKAVSKIQGRGKQQGTYAIKELVYSYSMWLSAKFHIAVIRAYDALQNAVPSPNCINLALPSGVKFMTMKFDSASGINQRYFVSIDDDHAMVKPIPYNCLAMTESQWINYMTKERGYIVKSSNELIKLLTN